MKKEYKAKLLKNNTGVSIKNWLIYATFMMGIYILFVVGTVLLIDGLVNKSLQTNLQYIPPLIDAVVNLIFAGAVPKIVGEGVDIVKGIKHKLTKEE